MLFIKADHLDHLDHPYLPDYQDHRDHPDHPDYPDHPDHLDHLYHLEHLDFKSAFPSTTNSFKAVCGWSAKAWLRAFTFAFFLKIEILPVVIKPYCDNVRTQPKHGKASG